MQRILMLCVLAVLSRVSLASDEKALADSGVVNATGAAAERGTPDADGQLDLAALGADGALQLLASTGEGCFEDVTEPARLSGVENAALALWADYDGDGRLDLFVGAREGRSRLFHNEEGVFTEASATSGLHIEGTVHSAHWLDHDGDGLPDLHVVSAQGHELFRGREGGFFDRVELPAVAIASCAFVAGVFNNTVGSSGTSVFVDNAGELGTIVSSRRFKEDITDMGDLTDRLLELRPVAFRYKAEVQAGEHPLEYGLIAEEVAEVFPDLVVYDEDGKPFTVKYHLLSSMLLNELEKMNVRLAAQDEAHSRELADHADELEELRSRLTAVETRASLLAQARELPPGSK